jgi:hypothetical protein
MWNNARLPTGHYYLVIREYGYTGTSMTEGHYRYLKQRTTGVSVDSVMSLDDVLFNESCMSGR